MVTLRFSLKIQDSPLIPSFHGYKYMQLTIQPQNRIVYMYEIHKQLFICTEQSRTVTIVIIEIIARD